MQLPVVSHKSSGKALIRLWISPSSEGRRRDVVQYLAPSGLSVLRIDRRPSDDGLPFRSIYFVEATDTANDLGPEPPQALKPWPSSLDGALDTIKSMGGEVDLIGLW